MRDYGAVSPRFWTGTTGKKLRGYIEAQLVALYLQTAPGSHMIGLYTLALPTLCHETGLSIEGASKGLARLSEVGFAHFDEEEEVVWVPEMARFQIGDELRGEDKRIKGVENELQNFRKSRFFNSFLDKYARAFALKIKREPASPIEGPSKVHQSPSEAKTGSGQEQDQDHEQSDLRSEAPAAPAAPAPDGGEKLKLTAQEPLIPAGPRSPLLEYLAVEFPKASADAALEKAWADACPAIDLLAEAKKARAWELSNPKRVAKMKRAFLRSWFDKAHEQQRKEVHGRPTPAPARRGYVPMTGTAERFAGLDDGDPLGLNEKPKEADRGE